MRLRHVLEYSAEHLAWQFESVGFKNFNVRPCDFGHVPYRPSDRMFSVLSAPLRQIPRFRDNLLAIAWA